MQDIALATLAFFILFVISAVLCAYILNRYSKGQQHETIVDGEYTLSTLLLPWKKGLTLKDSIMMIFVSPYFWFFEFISVILFMGLMLVGLMVTYSDTGKVLLLFIASGLVSFAFTFFYAVILWLSDYKEREPLRFIPTLFLWGCVAAFMAAIIESILSAVLGVFVPEELSILLTLFSLMFSAPIIEEFSKGLGVLIMSYHHEFDGVADGMVYGFIIGAGFAFLEDWGYYLTYTPTEIGFAGWIGLIALRTVLTGAVHGIFTGFTGAILGFFKEKNIRGRWLAFPVLVLVGGVAHMIFNSLTIVDSAINTIISSDLPLCILGFTIILMVVFVILIKKNLDKNEINGK